MKIGIVGLGLMGGSIAKALNQSHHIVAYDINADALDFALSENIIHEGVHNLVSLFEKADVVFLCLYPQALPAFIKENMCLAKSGTVVIEISGVKSQLIDSILPALNSDIDLVFTHPVAGSEKIGIRYAKDSIFKNANYVIVPTDKNKNASLELTETLAREMGFKNVSYLTKEQHDEIIAFTSQLTHVISLALVNSEHTDLDTKRFIGDSYRDLTRIAMINAPLWGELFLENKAYLLEMIDRFDSSLKEYRKAIEENDLETLKRLMKESREKRLKIEGGSSS